jgi:hypothetical protein
MVSKFALPLSPYHIPFCAATLAKKCSSFFRIISFFSSLYGTSQQNSPFFPIFL